MAANPPKNNRKTTRWLKLALKLVITGLCIWYVSGKIDFARAGSAIRSANWLYLGLALLLFVISKIFSAIRLNIYFHDSGVRLGQGENLRLYWLGMFYNLFLPGSISGDAYKVVLVSRQFGISYRKAMAAIFVDRFSGLLGLGLILAVYSFFVLDKALFLAAVAGSIVLAFLAFYLVIRRYFPDFRRNFLPTLFWAVLVQLSQVVCAYLIMTALGIPAHVTEYIFLFLVSSVVAVLPLTIGGLGAREIVFLEGAAYFGLIQENSVVISILFYVITLVGSLPGLVYVFRQPLKRKKDS